MFLKAKKNFNISLFHCIHFLLPCIIAGYQRQTPCDKAKIKKEIKEKPQSMGFSIILVSSA